MAIYSIWNKCFQQRGLAPSTNGDKQRERDSSRRNRRTSNKFSNWTRLLQLKFHHNKSRGSIPVYPDLHGSRNDKPNCDSKNNRSYFSNRYHKYLYAVIALLVSSPVSAADVGGVSATANPIANSSGSVTNQAYPGFTRSLHHQHIRWWDQLSRSNC